LNELYEEIVKFARLHGLRVFPGTPLFAERTSVIEWTEESDDSKSFIDITREEGAKTIVVSKPSGGRAVEGR
jgi:hypothetical protein